MGWKIEYYDGTWIELTASLDKIMQELDGHEEAIFKIANNSTNRGIVGSNKRVRISFDSTVIFEGMLYGVVYGKDVLACIAYNECYEKMKAKDITETYESVPADTILSDICIAAGVVKGQCPTTPRSVRFRRTLCFDAAVFLADSLNKNFWGDYDASGNPRFNIGTKINSIPYPVIIPISWPDRGVDRSKIRDKIIIRGVDSDGNEIEGSAGTGTNIGVFTEKKASDVATLNSLASKKLTELNRESSGVKLPVKITDGYDLETGYYIVLDNPELDLSGAFRIFRITKKATECEVEVDRAEAMLEPFAESTRKYEDLGIYPIAPSQLIIRAGTSFPSSPAKGMLFYRTDENIVYRYNGTDWERVVQVTDEGASFPSSPKVGDLFYRTDENIMYRYNGTSWVRAVQILGEGTSFPLSPKLSDMFYRTDENKLYEYNGTSWVVVIQVTDEGTSFPTEPKKGDTFYRTDENKLYFYNGSSWVLMVQITGEGSSFPTQKKLGDMFYRTDLNELYRWNGSSWVRVHSTTGEGTSFPTSPQVGDLFFRTDDNLLYRWDGSSWKVVQVMSSHGTSPPPSPRKGDFFYNTSDRFLYRYDGSNWIKVMHQDYGSSFPTSPETGDTFYHSGYEQTFYYDGTQWLPLATISRSGTSFPANKVEGDVFFRTDELKFYRWNGSAWIHVTDDILSSPQDNMVPNASFEIDRDGDGIPDYWTWNTWEGPAGTKIRSSTVNKEGKYSAGADLYAGQIGGYRSIWIPVDEGKTYLFRAFAYSNNALIGGGVQFYVTWADKDKLNEVNDTVYDGGISAATWTELYKAIKCPSDKRYVKLSLRGYKVPANTQLYFDSVWMFKQISWDDIFDEENTISTYSKRWQGEGDSIFRFGDTSIFDDSTASGGKCIGRLYTDPSGDMWWGPYRKIGAGEFYALFAMKVDHIQSGEGDNPVIRIKVSPYGPSRTLTPNEIGTDWKTFALRFRAQEDWTNMQLQGLDFVTGRADVFMDWIGVVSADVPIAATGATIVDASAIYQVDEIDVSQTVGALTSTSGTWVTCPADIWKSLGTFTVPAGDHDVYFVNVRIWRYTTGQLLKGYVKIYDQTDGIHYPGGASNYIAYVWDDPPTGKWGSAHIMITIPKNVAGHTLRVDFCNKVVEDDFYYLASCWGHSRHTHGHSEYPTPRGQQGITTDSDKHTH